MAAHAHSDPPPAGIVTIAGADGWSLEHHGYDTSRKRSEESVFSLTNGFLGIRASRDEGSADSTPALFMAGVYDEGPTGSEDLVFGPDITTARILIDGEELSGFRLVDQCRRLDLRAQTLERRAVFESPRGVRVTLSSTWAASFARRHLATRALVIETSAAADVSVWVGATAARPHPLLPIGHEIGSATVTGTAVLTARTSHGVRIEAAISATAYLGAARIAPSGCSDSSSAGFHVAARVTPGRGLGVAMHAAVFSSKETRDPASAAVRLATEAQRLGFEGVLSEHRAAWAEAWETADVEIDGDPEAQLGVRYAAMQMIAVCPPAGVDASIAAKGLSGPGYKGHVFWDNEVPASVLLARHATRRAAPPALPNSPPRRRGGPCRRGRLRRSVVSVGIGRHRDRDHAAHPARAGRHAVAGVVRHARDPSRRGCRLGLCVPSPGGG